MPSSAVFHTPLATVSWNWGTSGVVRGALAGEVDATNRREVLTELRRRLQAPGVRAVRLDVARLTFCDARALVGLAEAAQVALLLGVDLEIVNLVPHIRRQMDLLDVERLQSDHR